MFDKLKEECGVFGVYSKELEKSAYITYIGLAGLQHRGEESAGIAVNTDGVISYHKDIGHVADVFTNEVLENLPEGNMSIGHVKYSTKGTMRKENAQPIVIRHKKGNLAVVSNGCIVNAEELRQELEEKGAIFTTTGITELICHIIVRERLKAKSAEEAVLNAMKILKGSYSLLVMTPKKLIAVRDPQGFKPLCMGRLKNDIVFASESCALDICGAEFEREIKPGEIVVVQDSEIKSMSYSNGLPEAMCVFEYIYFSRPDSIVEGLSVHEVRENAGKYLALQAPVDCDIVASVPDSGTDAALGYSKESKIPYDVVFVKSKYIGRTFIQNTQNLRQKLVAIKLNALKKSIEGKKIVLVDDSIVRGTTIAKIIKRLRRNGAKEVHMRIASPMFINICYFGTDIDDRESLIANNRSVEEIRELIGADSLEYLSLENLDKITEGATISGFCKGCFTGKYPIEVPEEVKKPKSKFEDKIKTDKF